MSDRQVVITCDCCGTDRTICRKVCDECGDVSDEFEANAYTERPTRWASLYWTHGKAYANASWIDLCPACLKKLLGFLPNAKVASEIH